MALPNVVDPGGDEDFDPMAADVPEDTALPDPRLEKLEAEHEELIGDLGAIEAGPTLDTGADDSEDINPDLEDIDTGPPPQDLLAQVQQITEPPPNDAPSGPAKQSKAGRYYVPPKQRTAANREDRRATALERKGRDIEAFHAGMPGEPGFGDDEGERGDFPGADAVRGLMDADIKSRDGMSKTLIDHTRKIDEMREQLEAVRM